MLIDRQERIESQSNCRSPGQAAKRTGWLGLAVIGLAVATGTQAESVGAPAPSPTVQMLVPGFTVRELPVKLTSLNNIEYAPDGRLFAAGYDGRFHVLRDTDGDGMEDKVDTFSPETSANYPLGMTVKDGDVYAVLTDEVIRWRDTNGDGIPDQRETVVKGFDTKELVEAPYLVHRRVDSSMAITFGADGAMYITMGNSAPFNAYWDDAKHIPHYSTDKLRGCLLRFGPDGKMELLASGLRYIMALQFNQYGDLFGTDQEGATWVPNGNPFDELLHIQAGRHYGFPPMHPKLLPNVIDEPSVFDYAPQHESTCGFRFNGPAKGRGQFGPKHWAQDALITGESRGKLWRTQLAKTAAGYVAMTQMIARVPYLVVDCAVSPPGDLVICCHSGKPDWGNGPNGAGHLFKIHWEGPATPQPVLAWAASKTETVVAFDHPVAGPPAMLQATNFKIDSGRYVSAADRWERFRPGYAVVELQQKEKPSRLAVVATHLSADRRNLTIETPPRASSVNYALSCEGFFDMAHDLSGVAASWKGPHKSAWSGWLPHPDLIPAREFTQGSAVHDALWNQISARGELTLNGQLDLWQMLIPATQPGSKLDYTPDPETVTVVFKSDADLQLTVPGAKVDRLTPHESRFTPAETKENVWPAYSLKVATPLKSLEVSFFTTRDARPRALPLRRFLLPFAVPADRVNVAREIPEIAGGNWQSGRELFRGKASCATCHQLRGEGFRVGPELGNLIHRDYTSVLRDIVDPNAAINPDAVGYIVSLRGGEDLTGTRLGETPDELQIAQPGGVVVKLKKSDILKTEPMKVSLMPTGLDRALSPTELRDLMTYLLTENK